MQTRKLTKYHIHTGRLTRPVDFAVVSDLHDEPYDDLWPLLDGADALLVPGDVCDRYRQSSARGVAFLKEAAGRLPTFFSLCNHETRQKQFRLLVGADGRGGADQPLCALRGMLDRRMVSAFHRARARHDGSV